MLQPHMDRLLIDVARGPDFADVREDHPKIDPVMSDNSVVVLGMLRGTDPPVSPDHGSRNSADRIGSWFVALLLSARAGITGGAPTGKPPH